MNQGEVKFLLFFDNNCDPSNSSLRYSSKPIKMRYHHYYLLLIFLGCSQKDDCFTIRENTKD